jgi:hypothetical protein
MVDQSDQGLTRPEVVQILSTEHFTLQGARASAVAETNGRLQLYIGALSGMVVALALAAQVSRVGTAFYVFAFVVLPAIYFLGVVTMGRLAQAWMEWFRATQGMARIRHFYLEVAPEIEPYLVLPAHDDPWTVLSGGGIASRAWWGGLLTAGAVVGTINSLVAGALGGLAGARLSDSGALWPAVLGGGAFVVSLVLLRTLSDRWFSRQMAEVDQHFPTPEPA